MTTLQQLPQALTTSTTDLLLVEQGDVTGALTLGTLLQGTQAKLTLASGALLGRASVLPGSPEPIGVGTGLVLETGVLTINELTIANLDSPVFQGNPTAPTPAFGDASNAIATTAYVQANLPTTSIFGDAFGSGTGTLILTLSEITIPGTFTKVTVNGKGQVIGGASLNASDVSWALGFTPYSSANPAGYVTSSVLSGLAPLASPALSGTPTAPTPPSGDDSIAVATTAFVHANAGSITITGDVSGAGAGSVSVTLPAITSAGTYAKVTVNAKGQVTAGGTLDADDLVPALGFMPYNAGNPAGYLAGSVVSSFPVLSYGAFFDGIHDDYPGITAAIAAANAAGGGDVIFPPRLGLLSQTILQPHMNVGLRGVGAGLSVYNSQPTLVTPQTRLTWIGVPGGTMFLIGAPNNPAAPSGLRVMNAPVDGILADGAMLAAIGWDIRSVAQTNFGSINAMQCTDTGVNFGTSWLVAQVSATTSAEVCDSQGNFVSLIYVSNRGALISTTVASGGGAGTASETIDVSSTAGFVVGMQVQVGVTMTSIYKLGSIGRNTLTFTTAVTAADNTAGNFVMFGPYSVRVGGQLPTSVPTGFQIGGAWTSGGPGILEAGDCSGNRFERIIFDHDTYGGHAVRFGDAGENKIGIIYGSMWTQLPAGSGANTFGRGLVLDGWTAANNGAGANNLKVEKLGTSYAILSTESGFDFPPELPIFDSYNSLDGNQGRAPIDTDGVTYIVSTDNNNPTQAFPGAIMANSFTGVVNATTLSTANLLATGTSWLENTIIYEAGWEPVTGTFAHASSTSLVLVNSSNDHLHLVTGIGGIDWQVRANAGTGCLEFIPIANAGSIALEGPAGVSVSGPLVLDSNLSVAGISAIAGLEATNIIASSSLVVEGATTMAAVSATAVTAGELSVTGVTTLAAASAAAVTVGTLSVTGATTLTAVSATNINANGTAYLHNLVAYETTWEPISGTFAHAASSSLVIVNQSNDHLHIVSAIADGAFSGASDWLLRTNDGTGCFEIIPVANTGSIRLEGTLGVEVSGPLVIDSNLFVDGTATLAAVSATTISVGGVGLAAFASAAAPVQSVAGSTGTITAAAIASAVGLAGYAPIAASALAGNAAVQVVASVAALRSVAYSALSNGVTVMVQSYATAGDGGAGLFVWNASSTAVDNSGIYVSPTGNSGSGRWVRQLPDGRVTPQMFGAAGDGATNDTTAFNNALASGNPVAVPNAIYRVASVTVPTGAYLEGCSGLGYSYEVWSSPNSSQSLAPVRPILAAVSGTTSCILNVYGSSDLTIKGLFLDGGANTPICDGISSGSAQMLLERVTVTRCVNGLGSVTNTDLYTHVAAIIYCEFCNNTNGISNLIDSNLFHTAVSANSVGVNLGSGAGANTFLGGRYEWNTSCGMEGYNCSSNMVIGGLFDRNSGAAVNLGTGCADFTFNGVQFNRNGANNTYPGNAHIQLNGTASVVFLGCVSQSGNNNAPTGQPQGNTTPAYFIEFLNTNGYCVIEGTNCSGYVTGFSFGANPTQFVQRDNIGAGANFANAQQPFMSNGRIAQTTYLKASQNITPAQSATFAMMQAPFTSNYSVMSRALNITAENFNSPYQQQSASFKLMFDRGTTTAFNAASAAFGECGGIGVITWGPSSKLGLAIAAVASDASTFTLTVTNNGTADGSNWGVWAELE